MLGALHALEPGHGKTFITAFMLGNKGNFSHVITLGLSLAFSHTIMLLFFGIGLNLFLHQSFGETFSHYIEIASTCIMLGLGIYMIYTSYKSHPKDCNCHQHKSRKFTVRKTSNETSHRVTAVAGFVGGLIPCPSALGAFFLSGSGRSLNNSFWFVVLYVSGLVFSLILLAFVVSIARTKIENSIYGLWFSKKASLLSGILITVVGIFYFILHTTH
jgi:ABC-type nickel/cobalt efflux system permease component RcnA